MSSGSSNFSASPAFPHSPMRSTNDFYPTIPNTFSLSPPVINPQPPVVTCMWGDCGALFTSLSDLVGHVNMQHLHLPSPTPMSSTHPPEIQHQANTDGSVDALSCLWGDCNLYPSPDCIPGPSTGNPIDAALSTLASHLFQDHLGLPNNTTFTHVSVSQSSASFDAISNISIPPSTSTPPSNSPDPIVDEYSAKHLCSWQSCSQTFASCDELTAHITSVHVGAGKAHYECFWDGCNRHGDQGFASKQKICRHMQVPHLLFVHCSSRHQLFLVVEPYWSQTLPVQGVQAEFLRGCNFAAAYAAAYARKLVAICILPRVHLTPVRQNRTGVIFQDVVRHSR